MRRVGFLSLVIFIFFWESKCSALINEKRSSRVNIHSVGDIKLSILVMQEMSELFMISKDFLTRFLCFLKEVFYSDFK